jgi:CRISPR-associated protein Csh1
MIKELINFTKNLDEEFKNLGSSPKEGLHIRVRLFVSESGEAKIDTSDFEYEQYSKKQKGEISDFLNQCKLLHQNAWCIDTNKCFDLPTKAIHTCSPFALAFKREHLEGGAKFKENIGKKKQIYERFGEYFNRAFDLFENKEDVEKYVLYKNFFTHNTFTSILQGIEEDYKTKRIQFEEELLQIKERLKNCSDKTQKEELKEQVTFIEQELLKVKPLDDSDYVLFYLDVPLELYSQCNIKYLKKQLFNKEEYNTPPNEDSLIFGASNFMNGFPTEKPFIIHQTASFDISGRISNVDAKLLNDLNRMFPNNTLPTPLPIFIYKAEIQDKIVGIFRESRFKFGYKEILEKLFRTHNEELENYYLLFWQNSQKGPVFYDFDFVSKFEYKLPDPIGILNLFDFKEKGEKVCKTYPIINNIFALEEYVFRPLIQSKFLRIDYFGDLKKKEYEKLELTFISYCKYRKAVYDYVYKSQRNTIDGHIFDEMVFNAIKDDIKNNKDFKVKEKVKEKLNIWYSLYEYFNTNNKINMVNKLKDYQDFVAVIIADETLTDITDEKFAFAAGQVIEYILSKSKSADNSYNLLEPYLQQSKCAEFKRAIANDFGRYKHETFSKNFEKVAAFVLSYETPANLKHLLPQILSGVFSKNQLFSTNLSK